MRSPDLNQVFKRSPDLNLNMSETLSNGADELTHAARSQMSVNWLSNDLRQKVVAFTPSTPNSQAMAAVLPDFWDGVDGEGGEKDVRPRVGLPWSQSTACGLGYRSRASAGLRSWLASNFLTHKLSILLILPPFEKACPSNGCIQHQVSAKYIHLRDKLGTNFFGRREYFVAF